MSRKTTKFQEQIEVASSTMKTIKLTESLQRQVQEYLTMKQSDLENQRELDNLLSLLSPSLRLKITQQVFLSSIRKMMIFSAEIDAVDLIVRMLETVQVMPEDYVIK
jgi:hypothetical protein